jgi:hypothetical protein
MLGPGVSPTPAPTGSVAPKPVLDPGTIEHIVFGVAIGIAAGSAIAVILRRRKNRRATT